MKDPTMAGIAGVMMVRSSADSVAERQSGVMVRAMVVPESFGAASGGSGGETGGADGAVTDNLPAWSLSAGALWRLGGSAWIAAVVGPVSCRLRFITTVGATWVTV